MKLLTVPLAVALCTFAVTSAKASDIIQTVTISLTAITQSSSGVSNGTTTNVPSPKASSHTSAQLIQRLAVDEAMEGNWASNTFPAAAKLAVVPGNGNGADFAVILGTNILVDVSDIVSFHNGQNQIVSGAQNIQSGLASPSTKKLQIGTFSFDDTLANNPDGAVTFYLQGLFTETTTDTAPKNGFYKETRTAKMTGGTGEGTSAGDPFVCTGTLTATGSATLAQ